jgi:hypothetical protein
MNAIENLSRAARTLGELNQRVVFVGGATIDWFITDRAAGPARFTEDVDVIVDVASRTEYYEQIERALRDQGFKPDMREDAPICRWVHGDLTLDVMPTDSSVLGFTNIWYVEGIAHAQTITLERDVTIRLLSAPYLLATKLEAFKGRGNKDYLGSADIEDIVRVIDGRPELGAEIKACGDALREYLQREITVLLEDDDFVDALPGHVMGGAVSDVRAELVLGRLRVIAQGA